MKKIVAWILVMLLTMGGSALAEEDAALQAARGIFQAFAAEDFEAVYLNSTPEMQKAVGNPRGYEILWAQLNQYGRFVDIADISAQKSGEYWIVMVRCEFEQAYLTLQVTLDGQKRYNGFFLNAVLNRPDAAADEEMQGETVLLRAGEADETAAQLLVPQGEGPFPAVIFIHGSGPSDLDGTAYGNRPFKEMAQEMCKAGIASLRYDKYTFAHADLLDAEKMAEFTVSQEYFSDVLACVQALEEDERISHIYLMGHSQGGMLVPRLLCQIESEKLSGGVLLASSPLHLWEIQYEQNLKEAEKLTGTQRDEALAMIEEERFKAQTLLQQSDESLKDMTVFGLPAIYHKDEMSVDAAMSARQANLPLLIVQGGKDWQISQELGLEMWQRRLAGMEKVTYQFYPGMNHMLQEQKGHSAQTLADYQHGGGVSDQLLRDAVQWIEENSR